MASAVIIFTCVRNLRSSKTPIVLVGARTFYHLPYGGFMNLVCPSRCVRRILASDRLSSDCIRGFDNIQVAEGYHIFSL